MEIHYKIAVVSAAAAATVVAEFNVHDLFNAYTLEVNISTKHSHLACDVCVHIGKREKPEILFRDEIFGDDFCLVSCKLIWRLLFSFLVFLCLMLSISCVFFAVVVVVPHLSLEHCQCSAMSMCHELCKSMTVFRAWTNRHTLQMSFPVRIVRWMNELNKWMWRSDEKQRQSAS